MSNNFITNEKGINKDSYSQNADRLNLDKISCCDKCSLTCDNNILYSCSHKICSNCIYKYFMLSNFEELTTSSVKTICPKCKNGDNEINFDNFIELLNSLLYQKNPSFKQEDNQENVNNHFCKIHKDKKLIKYCEQCTIELCEKCLKEMHNRNFSNHNLTNISENENNDFKIEKSNSFIENIKNNREINNLQEKETIFMQKLESEIIMTNTKIDQIIQELDLFRRNYLAQISSFQNQIKKLFQIINLSYYNYHTSSDKKEITLSKQLVDFNLAIKKLDFNKVSLPLEKIIKEFESDNSFINFEFQWKGEDYKKKYTLKQESNAENPPDSVTKIIELKNKNKIATSLISGELIIWDLESKNIDYTIQAHKSAIWSLIILSDNKIATGASDQTIKIWDIEESTEKPKANLRGHKGTIFCLGEIEKNRLLSGSEDRTIRLWDLEKKKCLRTLEDPNNSKINCLFILPDPGFVVTGGDDNLLKIWNIYSDYIPNKLVGHECTIWSITSVNKDDTIIASGSSEIGRAHV